MSELDVQLARLALEDPDRLKRALATLPLQELPESRLPITDTQREAQRQLDELKGHALAAVHAQDVYFPAPTEHQLAVRKRLADMIGWENWSLGNEGSPPLPEAEARAAFDKGGSKWLYLYDREFVLSHPAGMRQLMVEEIALAEDVHDIAKDLLMVREEE